MRRRDFFRTLATAAAGFAILPSAGTYKRTWKSSPSKLWLPNPNWVDAEYEVVWATLVFDQKGMPTVCSWISREEPKFHPPELCHRFENLIQQPSGSRLRPT